ncbi:MAG: glycosyltransferase family 4 protein [Anaerolineaceae bacterium]|nr:glycosyltransferase family 4 protein [Anaerolineaceae bacterium]
MIWDHVLFPFALKRDAIDIAVFPKGTKSILSPTKDLVIINDLGYFYPELNAYKTLDTIYMKNMMRYAANHAWGVFTISEATRRDVIKHLIPNQENKVKTIYCASNNHYSRVTDLLILNQVKEKYNLQFPFIFYPTSISPRKNIMGMLDAWKLVKGDIPHHLYLTGGMDWKSNEVFRRFADSDFERIHLLGCVKESDMPVIYSLSDFVIYISVFEGFGLPVLEAMSCGVPVMAADISSIPEVTGDSALLIDPYSVQSIAAGLKQMANDETLKETLSKKGSQQTKLFSWERTGEEMIKWIELH